MSNFSHLDDKANPSMVDVGSKAVTIRTAKARSVVILPQAVLDEFKDEDIVTKKGSVFQTAILAGIMAVKKTSDLIPLCHPLAINKVDVNLKLNDSDELIIDCFVKTEGKTGVEMEALTGASVAALTVYDMCKAFSHDIIIQKTELISKSGGKRDFTKE